MTGPDFVMDEDMSDYEDETCTFPQIACGRAEGTFFYSTGCSQDGNTAATYYSDDQCLTEGQINVSYCTTNNCWDEQMACYSDGFIGSILAASDYRDNFDFQADYQDKIKDDIYAYYGSGCSNVPYYQSPTLTTICPSNTDECGFIVGSEHYINLCRAFDFPYYDFYEDSNCSIAITEERCSTILCNYIMTMDSVLWGTGIWIMILFCCCVCCLIICCCCCCFLFCTVKRDSSIGKRKKKSSSDRKKKKKKSSS